MDEMQASDSLSYLDLVATEIWHNCWSSCETRDLKKLTLVCHTFAEICQPLLFRIQYVEAPNVDSGSWMTCTQRIHLSVQRLLRLGRSPHAASVRSWYWAGDYGSNLKRIAERYPQITNISIVGERWTRLEQVFITTLGSYQRLKQLVLGYLTIDSDFRETLASLPVLEDLSLRSCTMVVHTGPLLSLRQFCLSGSRMTEDSEGEILDPQALEIVSPETIQVLVLDASPEALAILHHLSEHTLPSLTRLFVDIRNAAGADCFFGCLKNSSCLQELTLAGFTVFDAAYFERHLPQTALPTLNSFDGPYNLADLFTRERPVERLKLRHGDSEEEAPSDSKIISILRNLAPSVSVKELDIIDTVPISPANMPAIFAAVSSPSLRKLRVKAQEQPTPPAPPPTGVHGLDDEPDPVMTDDEDEAQVDDRVVWLWDEDDSDFETEEEIIIPFDGPYENAARRRVPAAAPTTPPTELPGYMYSQYESQSFPPVLETSASKDPQSGVGQILAAIYNGTISLPPMLEELCFYWNMKCPRPLSDREHHRAVLTLEKMFPSLRSMTLGARDPWILRCGEWVKRPLRIISCVERRGTRKGELGG
ncbi:hypothetical protein R3P38DRAFT_2865752 [Favolaschia claudopus]|uniref:F-box domain-containing protein n=1 Tax=Favolaschia claudopus TaxID=2862362 RepID=A0AAW0DH46_9AGAR